MDKPVIMCIDDDKNVLETLVRDLENKYPNFEIEFCESAAEALELRLEILHENGRIALYIVDSKMPGMQGIDFLKRVEDKAGRIMLTAYSDVEVAIEGINTKCIDFYLSKPYGDELFKRIDHLLFDAEQNVSELLPSELFIQPLSNTPTPYFLFNLGTIRENIDELNTHIKPDRIFYAVKCNSQPKVLQTMASKDCGFEINNIGEFQAIEKAGVKSCEVINSSPISSAENIKYLYKQGVRKYCFDSLKQLENIAANAPGSDVYVRIYNENRGSRFKLNRFGIKASIAIEQITYAKSLGLTPIGVTFHVGSQCSAVDNWREAIFQASTLFDRFPELNTLNIGGGFPITYKRDIPSLKQIGEIINWSIDEYFKERPIVFAEPGRFAVGNSAFACTSVINVDEGEPFSRAVVDMSLFAGLIELIEIQDGFQYNIITDADPAGPRKRYQIGGPSCAGTDIVSDEIILPRLSVDFESPIKSSRLYLMNTGAYTLDYIANKESYGFNGSKIPRLFFIENGTID
jgi:ornithine decarboxylase